MWILSLFWRHSAWWFWNFEGYLGTKSKKSQFWYFPWLLGSTRSPESSDSSVSWCECRPQRMEATWIQETRTSKPDHNFDSLTGMEDFATWPVTWPPAVRKLQNREVLHNMQFLVFCSNATETCTFGKKHSGGRAMPEKRGIQKMEIQFFP